MLSTMPTLPTGTHAQLRGIQQLNVNELVKECSNQINSLNFSSGSHYHCLFKNSKTPPGKSPLRRRRRRTERRRRKRRERRRGRRKCKPI